MRPALPIIAWLAELLEGLLRPVLIATLGWLLVAIVRVIDDLAVSRVNYY